MLRAILSGFLAIALLVGAGAPVLAQTRTAGGMGAGGGLGSGSPGSGSPTGGLSSVPGLSSTGFGSPLGGAGATGRTGAGGVGSTTQTYGANVGYGPYYANPLAVGFPNTAGSAQTASLAQQYQRAFPIQLSFGQALGGTTIQSRTGTNTPGIGTAVSGFGVTGTGVGATGGTATITNNLFTGANTAGIVRLPRYITEPAFERIPLPSGPALQSELQGIISRSSRLTSRGSITVSVEGRRVVLRGEARNERERRLAEALVRLTPGVREVVNDIRPLNSSMDRNAGPAP